MIDSYAIAFFIVASIIMIICIVGINARQNIQGKSIEAIYARVIDQSEQLKNLSIFSIALLKKLSEIHGNDFAKEVDEWAETIEKESNKKAKKALENLVEEVKGKKVIIDPQEKSSNNDLFFKQEKYYTMEEILNSMKENN